MMSPTDAKLNDRFLKGQRFRHRGTPRLYGIILRGFQRFLAAHETAGALSISIVQR